MKSYATFDSLLGQILLVSDGSLLTGACFSGQKFEPAPASGWRPEPDLAIFRDASRQLHEYFTGMRRQFDILLHLNGTPFQMKVWNALLEIPFGATVSYGELAARIKRKDAVRAVAAAVGRNPVSIIVPCHRVIGSGGSLTGYAGGLTRKRALLDLETSRCTIADPPTSSRVLGETDAVIDVCQSKRERFPTLSCEELSGSRSFTTTLC